MNPVSEEKLLQILRVEEPQSIFDLTAHLRDHTIDEIDLCLWELHRQGRVHRSATTTGEFWYFSDPAGDVGTPPKTERTQAERGYPVDSATLIKLINWLFQKAA